MKKIRILLSLILVSVFIFAGCQKKDNENNISAVDSIKNSGKITMITTADFPPFEYVNADGDIVGSDIDVANEIAKDLGVKLEIINMDFDLLVDSVKAGKGDFCAAGMTITDERKQQVDFSKEYVSSSQYVMVNKDSNIDINNIKDLTIAVQEGTVGDIYATYEIVPKQILRFKSTVDAGTALSAGKCDAVILDKLPAESIASNHGDLKVLETPLTEEKYAIAVAKGKSDLLGAINLTLDRLINEGKIDEYLAAHLSM